MKAPGNVAVRRSPTRWRAHGRWESRWDCSKALIRRARRVSVGRVSIHHRFCGLFGPDCRQERMHHSGMSLGGRVDAGALYAAGFRRLGSSRLTVDVVTLAHRRLHAVARRAQQERVRVEVPVQAGDRQNRRARTRWSYGPDGGRVASRQ